MIEQTFRAAPPIVQVLSALDTWSKLTPKQRLIVQDCRKERATDQSTGLAQFYDRFAVEVRLPEMPPRTLASLRRKGVADEDGNLTERGVYTALWQGGRK